MTSSLKELKHYLLWEKEEQPAILRLAEGMSAVAYNQLTNQLLQQPEDADQLVIRTIESPYDFFMLIEDALLTDYAIKNVLLAMDIVLFAGILLVWRQQYDADIEGLADFLAIEGQQDILAGIQKRIQQLDSGDFQLLETILHTHTLPDLDIS